MPDLTLTPCWYVCKQRGCREQGTLKLYAHHSIAHLATGRPLTCNGCGDILWYKRVATQEEIAARDAELAALHARLI